MSLLLLLSETLQQSLLLLPLLLLLLLLLLLIRIAQLLVLVQSANPVYHHSLQQLLLRVLLFLCGVCRGESFSSSFMYVCVPLFSAVHTPQALCFCVFAAGALLLRVIAAVPFHFSKTDALVTAAASGFPSNVAAAKYACFLYDLSCISTFSRTSFDFLLLRLPLAG